MPLEAGPVGLGSTSSSLDLADYLQHFGLIEDPFEPSQTPFFGGAGRHHLLDKLLHLCQFSTGAVAVLGESGVGKTAVKRALLSRLPADEDISVIDIPVLNNTNQVLMQACQGFGLRYKNNASKGQLLSDLRQFVQMGEEGSIALLVVDSAHNLDDQILSALLSLLQGQESGVRCLHILLFAEPLLRARLDKFNHADILIHDVQLLPFDVNDTRDYLQFRLDQAGCRNDFPFGREDIAHFWQISHGLPGHLHEPARRRLIELATPVVASRSLGLPLGHMVAIVLLGAGLLLALFYRDGSESEVESVGPTLPVVSQPFTVQEDTKASPDPDPDPEIPIPEIPIPEPKSTETNTALDTAVPTAKKTSVPPTPVQLAEPSIDKSGVEDARAVKDVHAVKDTPSNPVVTEMAKPVEKKSPYAQLSDDERALLASSAEAYTLQLLAAGSRKRVQDFIDRQPNRKQMRIFITRRRDLDWFVVVLGTFSSNSSARKAISTLPPEQREAGPWPRSLLSVQTDIRLYRGI